MMELRIDPEFESKIPPLTAEEFRQLEENILTDGVVINPIIVWNGVIVDGHNRYRIIEQNPGIQYTTHEKHFDDRYAVIAWICRNQLGRRNLTPEQKKYLIGKQYEAEKSSHGAKDGFRGNQHTSLVKCQDGTLPNQADTADRIAKENGIGRRSVFRAEAFSKAVDIADEVDPGIRYDLLSGKIKTNDKEIRELVDATPQERTVLVGELRKPPQERRKVLPERNLLTLEQLAAQPLADIENAKPDFMFNELDSAMGDFMFRWSLCLSQYRVYFTAEEHRSLICQRARDGIGYLNRIIAGDIPLGGEDDKTGL